MNDPATLLNLESIAQHYELPRSYERCIKFMLKGLELAQGALIEPARGALVIAERYWLLQRDDASLMSAKIELWEFLDQQKRLGELAEPVEAGVRAVLCVLEPAPPGEDTLEILGWYVQFWYGIGPPIDRLLDIAREHFPDAEI